MKRTIISIVCAVLIACLLFSLHCLQNMVKPGGYNTANLRGIYKEEPNSLDMIYIGGSAAFVYWPPLHAWHERGIASYVYGNDTLCAQNIICLMREAAQTQSPRVWVIDLRPFQYGPTPFRDGKLHYQSEVPIRNSLMGMHNDSLNKADIIFRGVNFFESLDYHFDLLLYRTNLETYLPGWKQTLTEAGGLSAFDWDMILKNERKNPNRGFYFVGNTKPVLFEDHSAVTEEDPLDPVMQGYLDELLAYCRDKDQKVLFIVHSYCQTAEDKRLYNTMKRQIEAAGFDFLNTNDHWQEIGLDYGFDLYNVNHVNIFGAEKYTDFVADYLIRHYDLPDHRGDAAYADWDICYTDYAQTVSETKQAIRNIAAEAAEPET